MTIDISKFGQAKIIVVGDLMIDEYLWGEVDRISPEAPVPVVSVDRDDFTLGGSGNVINNLVALGASVWAAGVVGNDRGGKQLLAKLNDLHVNTDGVIQEEMRPTTLKTRIISDNQHVLRIDRETRKPISERSLGKVAEFIENKMTDVDIILISDYGKGMITRLLVQRITAAAETSGKMTIVDPKGIDFHKYEGVTLITPNKKEAALASGIEMTESQSVIEAGHKLLNTLGVEKLLITCGKDGMVFFEPDREPFHITTQARQVYDVSGAGDTVLAVLGLALAVGFSFAKGISLANAAAGIVVGKVGTATVTPGELAAGMTTYPDKLPFKLKNISELPELVRTLRQQDKRIVMTNGCFDLLHAGHIMLFSASKKMGDILIVAIDDDESVTTLKGKGRPVINASERVRILSALDSVDYVVVFPSQELKRLIKTIQPDVLTKGSNYSSEEVFGREIVEAGGGEVILVPVTEKISSTSIINNIKGKNSHSKAVKK
jgi:D-beta-D-heptose 7-phosphate kinase/D-beta-D-heptose 1-phosphate adenosyltransferase